MRTITAFLLTLFIASAAWAQPQNLHDFTAETIEGEEFNFSQLAGKKVLIVNTASKCGFTPQYKGLQKLYEKYGGEDFTIIGFPANNFKNQEPGTDEEIKEFCTQNYGVTFRMMSKISVKGEDQYPIYAWLTQKEKNGIMDTEVKWNFQKYMVDADGQLVDYAPPKTKPLDDKIVNWITE